MRNSNIFPVAKIVYACQVMGLTLAIVFFQDDLNVFHLNFGCAILGSSLINASIAIGMRLILWLLISAIGFYVFSRPAFESTPTLELWRDEELVLLTWYSLFGSTFSFATLSWPFFSSVFVGIAVWRNKAFDVKSLFAVLTAFGIFLIAITQSTPYPTFVIEHSFRMYRDSGLVLAPFSMAILFTSVIANFIGIFSFNRFTVFLFFTLLTVCFFVFGYFLNTQLITSKGLVWVLLSGLIATITCTVCNLLVGRQLRYDKSVNTDLYPES